MKDHDEALICSLTEWGGGWAARALFDDAVSRELRGLPQNEGLARIVAKRATGRAASTHLRKYCRLTGIDLDTAVPDLQPSVRPLLKLEVVEAAFPLGKESDYWHARLCDHLGVPLRGLSSAIGRLLATTAPVRGECFGDILTNWSWPFIRSVLPLEHRPASPILKLTPVARFCWRRWHAPEEGQQVLLETPDFTGLCAERWFVWRCVHDATHMLHLAQVGDRRSPLDPEWLLTMEAAAMTVEMALLDALEERRVDLPEMLDLNIDNVISVLLLGMVERSLRLDFDLQVSHHALEVRDWLRSTKRRIGIEDGIYAFVSEFDGLPGMCAGYLVGMRALHNAEDTATVLAGLVPLQLTRLVKEDPLSRAEATDVPSRRPLHEITIHSVGCVASVCRFIMLNPFSGLSETVQAEAEVSVDLGPDRRGVHMSRLQQVLVQLGGNTCWDSLDEVACHVAREIKLCQAAENGRAQLSVLLLVDSTNCISGTRTQHPVRLRTSARVADDFCEISNALTVDVMNACPCTLEYSRLRIQKAVSQLHPDLGPQRLSTFPPAFTHSQPGTVTVQVTSRSIPIRAQQLLQAVNRSAHVVESVLKRPDEHALTEEVHRRPQFCEDLCRSVIFHVGCEAGANDVVEVTVEINESIHPHRVAATAKCRASDVWNC